MPSEQLYALLNAHLARTPVMGVQDVYKLLHQGNFGQGHPVPNRKAAREWLEQEASQIEPDAGLPLLESVHLEGNLVRVNLRPFLAFGGKLSDLLEIYIRSGEVIHGSDAALAAEWDDFCQMLEPSGAFASRFSLRDALLLKKIRQVDHWAAVHHTPAYIQRYRPVYRVVALELAETLFRDKHLPVEVV